MKGTVHKTEDGWVVKWSDLHSFGGGTQWSETPVNTDDQFLEEGSKVEFEFEEIPGKLFHFWANITSNE